MLTQQRLKELVHYDPDTGIFIWLSDKFNGIKAGDIAGGPNSEGYWRIYLDGMRLMAHRLAWLYVTGSWPTAQIDHINGIKGDNRLSNLREATNSQNHANRGRPVSNTSGLKGIDFLRGKWRARVRFQRAMIHIGMFNTCEEACAAYGAAVVKYFGEFARIA
jgi:hypothetical protein